MDWLNNITITCFAASYAVVLALDVSRIFFQAGFRKYLRIGFAAAGLFAHTVFLVQQGSLELNASGIWLGSWFTWCMAGAWLLAAAYLWVSWRHSDSAMGLFLLPVVLILIAVGYQFQTAEPFSPHQAKSVWNMVHGMSLLLGTTVVALGFVFGIIYLIQAQRLKTKSIPSKGFRLPSLEWLQQSVERSLLLSAGLLGLGLVSGIAINLFKQNPAGQAVGHEHDALTGTIAWSDPVVWSSAILFGWLLTATIVNVMYQPARQGRKVAYLVVTIFLFLVIELLIVWWAGHAMSSQAANVEAPVIVVTHVEGDPS